MRLYSIARIFDPFFTTKEEGTGLVENLHGRISIESEKGLGTKAYIDMPVMINT